MVFCFKPRGDLQLTVDSIRHTGLARLYEAFLRLKRTLEEAELFSAERKRALPLHPKIIGIITSPQAAAFHNVLTTLFFVLIVMAGAGLLLLNHFSV